LYQGTLYFMEVQFCKRIKVFVHHHQIDKVL